MADKREVEQRRSLAELTQRLRQSTDHPIKATELAEMLSDEGWTRSDDDPLIYVRTITSN